MKKFRKTLAHLWADVQAFFNSALNNLDSGLPPPPPPPPSDNVQIEADFSRDSFP